MRPLKLRNAECSAKGGSASKSVQLLAYGNDIDIIEHTNRDVTAVFRAIERECIKMDLAVNECKTKYMLLASRDYGQ